MKKNLILSILAIGLLFTSCKKDFLETEPTRTLSDAPSQTRLNGLYYMMVKPRVGGSTGGHEDFGQKAVDIASDLLSSDMAMPATPYPWFADFSNFKATKDNTMLSDYYPWRFYYRVVYEANKTIAGLASPKNDEEKYILAQVKAMRAYAYFYLMQLYTTKYEPTSKSNSIPLYVEATTVSQPKAQQSDVYALIVSDLEFAITNLEGFTRSNKGAIDKYVAKGLLAYVYAAMGENQKVADLSNDIITNSGYPLTTREQIVYDQTTKKGGGFNDININSWMWGFDFVAENGVYLLSWFPHVDIYTYGYAAAGNAKVMDDNLYALIKTNDLRKKQFDTNKRPSNKFFAPERKQMGQRTIITDAVFMRVDEFYLLGAEALAKLGQDAQAKTMYKKLLLLRYPEATAASDIAYVDALSNTDLLEDIYNNSRIELWGEGKSYLSLKRNKKSVTRGSNHNVEANSTFSYDNPLLTIPIPQNELINNFYFNL
jgi:hypothetical protein